MGLALLTWSVADPSLNHATNAPIHNLLGGPGAITADIAMQLLGLACIAALVPPAFWGWTLLTERRLEDPRLKGGLYLAGVTAAAALASLLPVPGSWPLPTGLGGVVGDALLVLPRRLFSGSTWGHGGDWRGVRDHRNSRSHRRLRRRVRPSAACTRRVREGRQVPRPPRGRASTTRTAEDEPGFAIVSIGAVIHAR